MVNLKLFLCMASAILYGGIEGMPPPPIVLSFDNPRLLRGVLHGLTASGLTTPRHVDLSIDISDDLNWDDILPDFSVTNSTTTIIIDVLRIEGTTGQISKMNGIIAQLTRFNAIMQVFIDFAISDNDFNHNQQFNVVEIDASPLWETLSRVNSVKINFFHPDCSSRMKIRLPLMTLPINSIPFLDISSKCKLASMSIPPCRGYEYNKVADLGATTINLCQCSSIGCQ